MFIQMFISLILALLLVPSEQKPFSINWLKPRYNVTTSTGAYTFKGIPKLVELAADEKREAYHYQQTLTIQDKGIKDGIVRRCEILEINDDDLLNYIYDTLRLLYHVQVKKVLMDGIFEKMDECDAVDNNYVKDNSTGKDYMFDFEDEDKENVDHGPNPLFNGIFPGTNWCGLGDIATGYHDLSGLRGVDRCCRAHDLCPLKVLSKHEKFNLKNDAKYTKSHCMCDERFHDCLKKDKGYSASIIGNLYFRAAHPNCIKGIPENPNDKMEFVPGTRKW